ncbi:hypothetical protein JCM8097_004204 [Rhodosporidiobolus ruineniae]
MAKLTDLPHELVDEIVALVFAMNPKQYLGAVHRLFLPSSRSVTFAQTEVKVEAHRPFFLRLPPSSARTLPVLFKVVKSPSVTGTFIRTLTLAHSRLGLPLGPGQMRSLFRQLPSVEDLTVHSEALFDLVLRLPSSSEQLLPVLRRLATKYQPQPSSPTPFDPRRFTSLHMYPLLRELDFEFIPPTHRELSRPYKPFAGHSQADPHRLWSLTLQGQIVGEQAACDLAGFFHVESLDLGGTNGVSRGFSFDSLLEKVQYPGDVHTLSLRTITLSAYTDAPPSRPSLSTLALFSSLSSLTLGECTYAPFQFPSLARLPRLAHLTVGTGRGVSNEALAALLSGPCKPPSLRTLALDLVSKTPPPPSWAVGECVWTSSFTYEGVVALLGLAERVGIELSGPAVDYVKRERDSLTMA